MEKHGKALDLDFVLDSSITMAWFFPQEVSPKTDALLQRLGETAVAYVPEHWILEITNTLAMSERKKATSAAKSTSFLELLGTLRIERDQETGVRAEQDVLSLARAHNLTTYDSAYLNLRCGVAFRSRLWIRTSAWRQRKLEFRCCQRIKKFLDKFSIRDNLASGLSN